MKSTRPVRRSTLLCCSLILAVSLLSGCASAPHHPSKRGLAYGYDLIVAEEAAGRPAFPKGNPWENYWHDVFQVLRSWWTPRRDYEDVVAYIKRLRAAK